MDYSPQKSVSGTDMMFRIPENMQYVEKTIIYKFALDGTDVKYKNKAEIEGSILNQFSMDEYNEYFRVAVTKNNFSGDGTRSNSIFVWIKRRIIDRIERIAKMAYVFGKIYG